ncbi:iron-siderophore ABC transporter substrate-binding protein [Mycetocola reblochoni]|uniref:ABC-type Fe3+-hydroxamate transport system, periplasmic component n=2 Tax=Mycetocola reblochoni TaxID=331618 RepID=A0A1R4JWD6_9MICO|nr:iron-siderophore ABC transporter substrate-binding protein [Mycetocola reblochoni]RLP70635.1 iron-siderophore ABC transporter substrate-binding protein [Mycetocola reblochoni]SJN36282.1 ABC-type Fe3+-hydroxamate transport system, periplasmic component [Mycetocola reblochoni REB411]
MRQTPRRTIDPVPARRPLRTVSLAVVGAVSALALAACSGSPAAEETTGTSAEGFPVTVDSAFGEVTIPDRPERVVALGWGDAEAALALGVQPVGASDWLAFGGEGVGPWAEDLYDTAPEIIGTLEPSYEEILALDPDVILDVKSSGDEQRYERLSEIAPTVGILEGGQNYLTSTEDQLTVIAEALGAAPAGEELLAQLDASFEAQRAAHPEFDGATATAAVYTSEGWSAYVEGDARVEFLERLGFEQNPEIAGMDADGGFFVPISSEDLSALDADLIVTFLIGTDEDEVTSQKLYTDLPAVKDGRALIMSDQTQANAFSTGSVLSTEYAIETVVPQLSEALDGK